MNDAIHLGGGGGGGWRGEGRDEWGERYMLM